MFVCVCVGGQSVALEASWDHCHIRALQPFIDRSPCQYLFLGGLVTFFVTSYHYSTQAVSYSVVLLVQKFLR